MNRVLVFGASGDKLGGINTFLTNMNKHMSGDCVFDYVIEGPNCVSDAEFRKDSKVFHFPYYQKNPIGAVVQLIKILKKNRKDHRVAYFNLYSMFFYYEVLLAKFFGYKIVLHAHNNGIEHKSGFYMFIHKINKTLSDFLNCIRLTNSDLSAEFIFGNKGKKKAEIIYNAIEVEKYRFDIKKRESVRRDLQLDQKKVIGFAGRLQEQKNPLFLIDIFSEYKKSDSSSVLLIAGDGGQRKAVEKRIAEKNIGDSAVMLGNRTDMDSLYQAMDMFLLPSLFEGLGIVLVEAQCAGLPCVTSDKVVPATVEIIDGAVKRVSLADDAKTWAEEVVKATEFGINEKAWQIVSESRFNIKSEAKRLEKVLVVS